MPSPAARHWLAFAYMLIATGLFVVLTFMLGHTPYTSLDLAFSQWLQSFRNPWLDFLMEFAGVPGLFPQVIPLNVLVILILFAFRLRWEALTLSIVGPVVGITSTLLRYSIDRPRPTPDLVWVAQEIERGHYSFPSGHALGFVAIFGFIWFIAFTRLRPSWQRTAFLIAYAALIGWVGISRVYVGEHWLTDVLAGYVAGSVYLVGMILLYNWGKPRFFTGSRPEAKADHKG